jgi:hypothetical protein
MSTSGAGTTVYVPVYAVHRHERFWCEPDRFDPSRFEPEAAKARDRYTYLPFGAGPRICIGQNFAQMEATAVLATLLSSFQLRLRSGCVPEPRLRVTLPPAGGMPMRIAIGIRKRGISVQESTSLVIRGHHRADRSDLSGEIKEVEDRLTAILSCK